MEEVQDIPLNLLEPNIFLTRYSQEDGESIHYLAESIKSQGQLEPIAVRPVPDKNGIRYQVIYGHRRLSAMKSLGRETIKAQVKNINDRSMLEMALVENLQRQNISDYEKGMLFRNLSESFNMAYEEIGKLIGKSKQLVSNHVAMTRLVQKSDLETDPKLFSILQKITEAQSRVLSRVQDIEERKRLLKLAVEENLCSRELASLVGRPRKDVASAEENIVGWESENMRNNSDNSSKMGRSKHGQVCILRTESLNFLISQLKISAYEAGAQIALGAAQILLERGIDPSFRRNWTKVLVEKGKYAGWGKMSTTTDSKIVVHQPTINSEFLRGYLETLFHVGLKCLQSNSKLQLFEILEPSNPTLIYEKPSAAL